MDWNVVLLSGGLMLILGAFLAIGLAYASKKFFVAEDHRVGEVEALLPGANCGGCGEAGCHALADAIVRGDKKPTLCPATKGAALVEIGKIVGIEIEETERQVARVACAGGNNVAVRYAEYEGLHGCRAAKIAGASKGCPWGCLGFGDCVEACPFDAININDHALPVVNEALCVGCGACVRACPKQLISLQPISNKLWVACNNKAKGPDAMKECAVACLGCGICVKDAPAGLISIEDNLAVVNVAMRAEASEEAIQRCPTGAIGWYTEDGEFKKGAKAKKIERETPLPLGGEKA